MGKSLISPLRYPGSKRRLVSYVQKALMLNKLTPQLYIEPFVGGASIALQLMEDRLVEKVILMDVDPWIASFWDVLFFDTDWLIDQIRNVQVTLESWYRFKSGDLQDKRTQALTCLFLNRTSFSGILEKKAGPLGGREQKSKYKIDCRFPREILIQRVLNAARHRDKIFGVWNCSWEDGINRYRVEQQQGRLPSEDIFFYLDPPFFAKADQLYRYSFREDDHKHLRDFLLTLEDKWLLSYDTAPQVEQLYGDVMNKETNGTNHDHIDFYYSVAIMPERQRVREVIISNLSVLPIPKDDTEKGSNAGDQFILL